MNIIGQNSCAKNIGGIRSIELFPTEALCAVDYHRATDSYGSMELIEGSEPIRVEFSEGGGQWSESADDWGGVTHRVECRLRGVQPSALRRLEQVALNGVVAMVVAENGWRFLVGYSPEATVDYPLRLVEASTDSHAERSEGATTRFVLASTDGWFSRPMAE